MSPAGWPALVRAVVGLAVVQFALPKLLPLPGVSERWWLVVLGGGAWGRLATVVGGALVAIWGVSLIPAGLRAATLGTASALAAVGTRLAGVGLALGFGASVRLGPAGRDPGLLLGLALVVLFYGGLVYGVARLRDAAG